MVDLVIKDFQSIEEAKIRVKGLTLVIGRSSSGKSACSRAVVAATSNRFRNGQVRYGQDHCLVAIRFPEESNKSLQVVRPWNGSIRMQLGNEKFDKIGRTLPLQINEFLNLGTIDVGDDKFSLNFHPQFQKPLLLEFSQKRVMDILSASKSMDDLNEAKDVISEMRVKNKGAFQAVSSILSESNEKLSEAKSLTLKFSDIMATMSKVAGELEQTQHDLALATEVMKILSELNNLINLEVENNKFLNICDTEAKQLAEDFYKISVIDSSLTEIDELSKDYKSKENLSRAYGEAADIVVKLKNITYDKLNLYASYKESMDILLEQEETFKNVVENHICPVCGAKVQ